MIFSPSLSLCVLTVKLNTSFPHEATVFALVVTPVRRHFRLAQFSSLDYSSLVLSGIHGYEVWRLLVGRDEKPSLWFLWVTWTDHWGQQQSRCTFGGVEQGAVYRFLTNQSRALCGSGPWLNPGPISCRGVTLTVMVFPTERHSTDPGLGSVQNVSVL